MVIGMVSDKDITTVLTLLPKEATYYFCAPNIARGLPSTELAKQAGAIGLKGAAYASVLNGVAFALCSAYFYKKARNEVFN